VRRGRGFVYIDVTGERVEDPEVIERLRGLAIPPAWKEVWICADPLGHLQATGIDVAGRKQYLYHRAWRERRDRQKFDRMLRFARALPQLRQRITADLRDKGPTRERVLACAARLLDVGLFRIGSEEYADENGGLGLSTIRKEHVAFKNGSMLFDYPAKGGIRRVQAIDDPICAELVRAIDAAVRDAAGLLGNTRAVARRSYIDPRVFDRYLSGWTIGGAIDLPGAEGIADERARIRLERAVLDLLAEHTVSPSLERIEE
jgi:DNA topoisomerase IB